MLHEKFFRTNFFLYILITYPFSAHILRIDFLYRNCYIRQIKAGRYTCLYLSIENNIRGLHILTLI